MMRTTLLAAFAFVAVPQAEAQALYARNGLECLVQNRALVDGAGGDAIFIDVSTCPPSIGGGGGGTEQQTVSKLPQSDSNVSSIVIMTPANRACYFDAVGRALAGGGDPVTLDASGCGG
jgi:hypothetical protein